MAENETITIAKIADSIRQKLARYQGNYPGIERFLLMIEQANRGDGVKLRQQFMTLRKLDSLIDKMYSSLAGAPLRDLDELLNWTAHLLK